MAKHAKKAKDDFELTRVHLDILHNLPFRFEFDTVTPHPTLLRTFHDLRRHGHVSMQWSEVPKKVHLSAMQAAYVRTIAAKNKEHRDLLMKQSTEKHIPARVKVLTISWPIVHDPEKAKRDAINEAAGRIKKGARKVRVTTTSDKLTANTAHGKSAEIPEYA